MLLGPLRIDESIKLNSLSLNSLGSGGFLANGFGNLTIQWCMLSKQQLFLPYLENFETNFLFCAVLFFQKSKKSRISVPN